MTNEKKQEYTLKISQANRSQMVVLIYDIARDYIKEAREALAEEKYPEFRDAVNYVQKCVNELICGLDFEYDLSLSLLQLYAYCNRELIRCLIKRSDECLLHVENTLRPLQESFIEVAKQDTSEPMIKNAQTVTAGMTYGRGVLNENLQGASSRGYMA